MADYSISAILKLVDQLSGPSKAMASAIDALSTSLKGLVGSSDQVNTSTKNMVSSMSGAMSDSMSVIEQQRKEDTEKYRELAQEEKDIMRSVAEEDKRVAAEYKDHLREKAEERKKEEEEYEAYNTSLNELDADRAKQIEEDAKLQAKAHQEAAKAAIEAAKQAQEAAKQAQESIMRMGESIMEFGQKMHRVGRWMTMRITLPLVAAGTASIKFAKDYTTSLASIQMLIPKTIGNIGKEINNIDKFILDLAPKVAKSPKELAEGLESITRILGYNSNNLNLLPNIAKAAFATQTEVKGVVEAIIGMGTTLRDTSEKGINRFLDLGMVFRNLTNIELPTLGKAVGRFGATSKGIGVPLEESFSMLAYLTNSMGGSVEKASTAYEYLLTRISRSESAMDVLRKEGFGAALAKIDVSSILKSEDPRVLSKFIGGSRTLEAFMAIVQNMKKIDEYREKFKTGFGGAEAAFQAFTKGIGNFNFQWESFKVSLQVVAIEIGKALLPALRSIFKAMQPIFNIIKNMNPETLKMIVSFLILVAAIGPLISFFANLTIVIAGLIYAWGWLVSGTAPLIAIIAGVAIVIGIVIAATMKFYNVWDRIFKWFKKMWNSFKDTIYDGVIKPIMNVYYAVSNLLDRLSGKNKKIFGHDRNENVPNSGIGKWSPLVSPIPIFGKWNQDTMPQKSQSEVTINVKPSSGWDVIVEDVNHSKNTKLIMNTFSYLGVTR